MKYTFTNETGQEKTVNIPDEYIKQTRRNLNISVREAIELWLFDNDYISNPEAEELTAKAKNAGVRNVVNSGKKRVVKRKPDETKRALIQELFKCIESYAGVCNAEVTNIERIIAFSLGEDKYEITLSKKRKPKN